MGQKSTVLNAFHSIKRAYSSNPVLQFLMSYMMVLAIPSCVMFIALQFTFSFVQNTVMNSNLGILNHSKQLLEQQLNSIQTLAGNIVSDENLLQLSKEEHITSDSNRKLNRALESLAYTVDIQEIDLLDTAYVVLRKQCCVLYKRGFYSAESFAPYINESGLSYPAWKSLYLDYTQQLPFFAPSKSGFDYIVPFGIASDNKPCGNVVCNISADTMHDIIGFDNEYGQASFFLMAGDTVLWSEERQGYSNALHNMEFLHKQGLKDERDRWVIYTKSEQYGWTYVLVVSSEMLLKRFYRLRLMLFTFVIIAAFAGVFTSFVMAVSKGKPVAEIFDSFYAEYPKTDKSEQRDMAELESLFQHLLTEKRGELFYPELLAAFLCKGIKSAENEVVRSIILMVKKENFENKAVSNEKFTELNCKILKTLSSFDLSLIKAEGRLLRLAEYAKNVHEKDMYFEELLAVCYRLCAEATEERMAARKSLACKIKQYIDENYMNRGLCLSMVASEFAVSESYVSMIYKEQIGVNFALYMEMVRIKHAVSMLEGTTASIQEISSAVGYSNDQSFRRAFKRATGKTPKDYR